MNTYELKENLKRLGIQVKDLPNNEAELILPSNMDWDLAKRILPKVFFNALANPPKPIIKYYKPDLW